MQAILEIDGVAPQSRMSPSTPEELAETLHIADEKREKVAPVGGGTQLDVGMPPQKIDLILETTGLSKVIEYEPADLTITVEAGIRFADLQKLLGEQGQFLALDPPAQAGATIGGLIATNASGPLRFSSGTARDLVLGIRVANPDGTLTRAGGRVVKNVAGYDLNKLYIGSLGTLGIIVELSFKLAPIPPATATIVGQFADVDSVRSTLGIAVRSPLSPLAIELLGPRAAAAARLPSAHTVVFRVGGYPQAVQRQVKDFSALLIQHGGRHIETQASVWQDLARVRLEAQRSDIVLKAAAPIAASAALVDILEKKLPSPIVWAHAGNGVAFAASHAVADASVLREIRMAITSLGENASLVIQRCPTELKSSIDVWGDVGSSLALMHALKQKLDPNNTLNPGRFVGGI